MSMELIPGRYVSRIFFAEMMEPFGPGDVMGYIYRDKGETDWQLYYRFRYYVDDDLSYRSKDRKSAYGASCGPMPIEQVIKRFRLVLTVGSGGGEICELVIDSDDPAVAMAILAKQPWAHVNEHKRVPGQQ